MRLAVIGSGIAGLGASYLLSRAHEVHLFEKEARIGGHTHTVQVDAPEGPVAVDTGFIVHNRATYPHFIRLMEELGVDTCESDMSFAYHGEAEWCSRGLNGVFTQRGNALRPRYYRFWSEVLRFNRLGRELLATEAPETLALGVFLDKHGFSADFRAWYLLPMAGAVWSTTVADMEAFPAAALLRFFENHGFLGVFTQHRWRSIPGGTSRYLDPISRPFRERIRRGVNIIAVRRGGEGAELEIEGQDRERFDAVVFACHGDQVLPLLADADPLEREVLSAFRANRNEAWLHRDTAILPKARRAWASWNFRQTGPAHLLLSYHMNRLQPLRTARDFLVSLNAGGLVREDLVDRKLVYEHPRFDLAALRAQGRWAEISGRRQVHFCGAYWRNGFHEDGLWSAIRVARALGVEW